MYGLIIILTALIAFEYGILSFRFKLFPYRYLAYLYGRSTSSRKVGDSYIPVLKKPKGSWEVIRKKNTTAITLKGEKIRRQFKTHPYLSGCIPAPSEDGITVFARENVFPGMNFFTAGHAPRAFLMDMKGNILHEWSASFRDIWPGKLRFPEKEEHTNFWIYAKLLDNGEILAIFDGIGLVKLDRDSKLLWAYRGGCHHDIDITEDGNIYTLTHKVVPVIKELGVTEGILDDHITILAPDGREMQSISVIKSFMNSDYAPVLETMRRVGDVLHTNSLQIITNNMAEKVPFLEGESVLISIRELNTIAAIDLKKEKVVWAITGLWARQHDARLLENGNLLLFDNLGRRDQSKVLEIDPTNKTIIWEYPPDRETDFFSKTSGACQRLPNGNTLITESNNGRVREVTPDNRIVWEYVVPFRAGKNEELIANLFRVTRVSTPPEYVSIH